MTTVYVYYCSCLLSLYAVGVVQTTVQVFVGRASFEQTRQRTVRMDDLGHVFSIVIGYRESLVVGPVCDRYRQGFQHSYLFLIFYVWVKKTPFVHWLLLLQPGFPLVFRYVCHIKT